MKITILLFLLIIGTQLDAQETKLSNPGALVKPTDAAVQLQHSVNSMAIIDNA